jgi:amidase
VPSFHKPSGNDLSLSAQMMSVQGALARSAKDLRLALSAMSRPDCRDPYHVSAPLNGEPMERPIRIGLLRDAGVVPPSIAVNRALEEAADRLKDAGYRVEEIHLPLFAEACKLWYLLVMEDVRLQLPVMEQAGDQGVKRAVQYYFEGAKKWWGESPELADMLRGYARRGTLMSELQQFMQDYPLLLMPVSAELPFEYDEDIAGPENMFRLMKAQWPMMSVPVLGFPAVSVPVMVHDGLPVGVQLVGRRFREDTILDAAEVLEACGNVQLPIDPSPGES